MQLTCLLSFDPTHKLPTQENGINQPVAFDADELAKQMRATRASNIMMLGAASHFMSLTLASIEFAIRKLFQHKGAEIVEMNLKALRKGREMAFEKV